MRKFKVLAAALVISTIATFPALADWKQESDGRWWYQNDDGSYPVNQWKEIGGKQYYFGADGYMLSNTVTPDGKQVGADGTLVQAPLFDFDIEDSHITYTGYKIKQDYNKNQCLVLYYDFMNKDNEAQSAVLSNYSIKVFQNGIECDYAIIINDRDDSMENYSKDIMPGTIVNVGRAYKLQDKSDVTIQIKELWNWSNPKSQMVTLHIQ